MASMLYDFLYDEIVWDVEPVNAYENPTATSCLHTGAAPKGAYGQDMGSINAGQI